MLFVNKNCGHILFFLLSHCGLVEKRTEKTLFMSEERRIAYGYNRSDKQFADSRISGDKYFIDNDKTGREELMAALMAVRPGVVVVVIQLSDFGKGAKAKNVKAEIEANGGIIEVIGTAAPKAKGRGSEIGFNDEELQWACELWNNPLRDKANVLARIWAKTGQQPDRHQMNYLCRRKEKRKEQVK